MYVIVLVHEHPILVHKVKAYDIHDHDHSLSFSSDNINPYYNSPFIPPFYDFKFCEILLKYLIEKRFYLCSAMYKHEFCKGVKKSPLMFQHCVIIG